MTDRLSGLLLIRLEGADCFDILFKSSQRSHGLDESFSFTSCSLSFSSSVSCDEVGSTSVFLPFPVMLRTPAMNGCARNSQERISTYRTVRLSPPTWDEHLQGGFV
ncbi:hypothetical protein HGRIS_004362 [Hohenbuehelia grisea]|uniref:Uncharacterized protein n=1 Tax=Hohenbuehelia grisea TaxID=104357 RepID=A0ABR3JBM2_9AGAR